MTANLTGRDYVTLESLNEEDGTITIRYLVIDQKTHSLPQRRFRLEGG